MCEQPRCERAIGPHGCLLLAMALVGCSGGTTSEPPGQDDAGVAPSRWTGYPTRVAQGPNGRIYVSDARAGAVAVFDSQMHPQSRLEGLGRVLGVAVAPDGRIFVGNGDRVSVYGADHALLSVIGAGAIEMPNDLALDRDGNLYVADSQANEIKIYAPDGAPRSVIGGIGDGPGQLRFPAAITIGYRNEGTGELFVADQVHHQIQVFALDGRFLRAFGTGVDAFSEEWKGRFVAVQGLALDADYHLHAVDSYMNNVQVLDADTGEYLAHYGGPAPEARPRLALPLDILITASGAIVITNTDAGRVEVLPAGF